jgi:adenylate cyclase
VAEDRVQRKLAAILAADVVGYSRLMEADEEGTLARLKTLRNDVIDPKITDYGGRIFKTTGDGILAEFPSAVDAVRQAVDVQRAMADQNEDAPQDKRIDFRIGISLGDVMVEGDDLFGNGVNVAARMEGLAEAGGICISGNVQEHVSGSLDATLEDLGEQSVKNIDRPVQCYRVRLKPADAAETPLPSSEEETPFTDKPAVAVLPFANMSGDADQEYFSDGLTEDIITALSLWRSFPVIARNSTFAYKGASPDIRKIGEELGARYVIEGSVRKAGDRVRITAQLIDAQSGHHLWADKYDRQLDDIFELQDEITTRVSAIVGQQMASAERNRSRVLRPNNLNAWDLYHRGMAHIHKMTAEENQLAREMFEEAIRLDPDFCQAYFGLGYSHHRDIYLDAVENHDEKLHLVFELARRAIALDGSNSNAHCLMAIANVWSHRYTEAIAAAEKALQLNPSNAQGIFTKGAALHFSGRPEDAIPIFEMGFALNPQDPICHIYLSFLAAANLNLGLYEKAEDFARQALQHKPDHFEAQLIFVSSLGHMNRPEDARDMIDRWGDIHLGELSNRAMIQIFDRQEDRDRYIDGLRKAGVPE